MPTMKVPQITVLSANDCRGTFYSFSAYVNETLRVLCRQQDRSSVRVVSMTERECVIEYKLELPADEV